MGKVTIYGLTDPDTGEIRPGIANLNRIAQARGWL